MTEITKEILEDHITSLRNRIKEICDLKHGGANEYAITYYQGKIDALKSLLKDGKNMYILDEEFGL